MGASHDEPTQEAIDIADGRTAANESSDGQQEESEKRLRVVHPKGFGDVSTKTMHAIRGTIPDGDSDKVCRVDHDSGLIIDENDPFFQPTVTKKAAIPKCKEKTAYFRLILPDDYDDELLMLLLTKLTDEVQFWYSDTVAAIANIVQNGNISGLVIHDHAMLFAKVALRAENADLFDKVLQEGKCEEVPSSFWPTICEAIRDQKDDFATGCVKALVRSKVDTFVAIAKHQEIVHIVMSRGVLEKYYDLIAFMARIYSKYANAKFARGIKQYPDLMRRLVQYGHINTDLLPEFKQYDQPAQTNQPAQVITSIEEFNEEIMKLVERFKPAKKQEE